MDDRHEVSEASTAADQAKETAAAKTPTAADRRIQRLEDLLAEALKEPDPLRAGLRAATADLLEIGCRLGAGIKAAMSAEPGILETYEAMIPAISSMALVHRQATQYLQLDRDRVSGEGSG